MVWLPIGPQISSQREAVCPSAMARGSGTRDAERPLARRRLTLAQLAKQVALPLQERRVPGGRAVGEQRRLLHQCRPRATRHSLLALRREAEAHSVPVPCRDRCAALGGGEAAEAVLSFQTPREVLVGRKAPYPRLIGQRLLKCPRGRVVLQTSFECLLWLIDIWSNSSRFAAARSARAAGERLSHQAFSFARAEP